MEFRKWFSSRVILANKMHAVLLIKDDIELLHQYRVNLRKIYACSEIYAKEIDLHSSKEFSKLIKKLLKPTAQLRDIDLFLMDIKTLFCSDLLKEKLGLLMRVKRENAFKSFLDAISSKEYKNSLEILSMMSRESAFFIYDVYSVDRYAIISKAKKIRYKKLSRVDLHTPLHELHNLRKEFKKFRYALDIYEHCFSNERAFEFDTPKLKIIQEFFGEIQDNSVRLELIKNIEDELLESEFLELQNYYELKLLSSKQALFENFDIL
ncbi:CHAD domain-containing protein [Sulfurimonas gotlandica]|nr:CHAD domain-containing protein [Sulfurimonas gotlandica]EDZ62201.1 conserved hypothetical protein [Sulfurimonas gotlandica GD1]